MIQINGSIYHFPKELKLLVGIFIIILAIGFFMGLLFVGETSTVTPDGIQEQYLGNEYNDMARVMKFKKSKKEMLTLIHNHILSMSVIFFLTGLILLTTKLLRPVKLFLLIEPFVSLVITFGGLYLLWNDVYWMKYVVMFSGILMTFSFTLAIFIVLVQLMKRTTVK